MLMKSGMGCILVGLLGLVTWGMAPLTLDPEIHIGERFQVRVDVADVLIVLNLNDRSRIYEFDFPEPGTLALCFVRPCDHPCECVPQNQIVLANPGDEILFIMKNHPQTEEMRRKVLGFSSGPPKVDMKIIEKNGGCFAEFTVEKKDADLTCKEDLLTFSLHLRKEEDTIALGEIELRETSPTSGVFMGHWLLSMDYKEGNFVVNGHVCPWPKFLKLIIKSDEFEEGIALVDPLPSELENAIPPKVRLACLEQALAQLRASTTAETFIHEKEGRLWVGVKDGCIYYYAPKEVEVLPSVELVVEDSAGRKLKGGYIEAGQEYEITAINGLPEGCILIVALGADGKACEAWETLLKSYTGPYPWDPKEYRGKTVAIIYLDPYSCVAPALIFSVD